MMKVLATTDRLCTCCMEKHTVQTVLVQEENLIKGVLVEYPAEYFYCDKADEFYADEKRILSNDTAMKDAYREKVGLLTSHQIKAIRAKYGITQHNLCLLLGWGVKTITRYENYQVQDVAHDTILRRLDTDPELFLQLLESGKEALSPAAYQAYLETGTKLFEQNRDLYLKRVIMSQYARFVHSPEATGGTSLSVEKVTDMIRYYANSPDVTKLYRVKLMKLLWYADALSYKQRGHAISGLVYRALPMGAVPVAYESIVDLSAVRCEEIEMGDGTAYRYLPTEDKEYHHLTSEDRGILDVVIERFGQTSKNKIVQAMHREDAYKETALYDVIQFEKARTLHLS